MLMLCRSITQIDAEVIKRRGEASAATAGTGKPMHGMFKNGKKEAEPVDIADRVPVDFFGRPISAAGAGAEPGTTPGGGVRGWSSL